MTSTELTIVIPLSKKKLILLMIASLVFISISILFVSNPEKYTSTIMRNSVVILIAGIAGTLFFGICFVFLQRN